MTAEILYPVSEVAELWRCSRDHVYELINRGHIRTVNLAKGKAKTRIPESALNAYVASLGGTEPPAGPQNPPNPTHPPRTAKARRTDPNPQPTDPIGPGPTPAPGSPPSGVLVGATA